MENQFKGYDNIFATTLREIMEEHPHTREKTTQKALAKTIGIRPQTVSLYMDGSTQPTADILYKIAKYFDVSVDYLLTGISSSNMELHKQLGLSEKSINYIKRAKETENFYNCTDVITTLNYLLSNRDFYVFLEDLSYKTELVKGVINQTEEEKRKRPVGINLEGYFIWDMQTFIKEYIHNELKKQGLYLSEE